MVPEMFYHAGVADEAAVDKATCDMAEGYTWKGDDGSFKDVLNWVGQECCKSYPSTFCGDFDGTLFEMYTDSACSKKMDDGDAAPMQAGKVSSDPKCVTGWMGAAQ